MADELTTNYSLVKPEVGASNDTWGVKLNANFDSVDAELNGLEDRKADTDSLGTMATRDTGTGGSQHRTNAQNDARFLQQSNNLSELGNAATARGNLGLGSAATEADSKYARTAGDSGQVFSVANATANAHAVSRSFGDGRYLLDSANTVTSSNIAANAVGSSEIAGSAVGSTQLASDQRMTTANVAGQTAGVSLGAVGSYGLVRRISATGVTFPGANPGDTVAGSGLRYASAGGDFGGPSSLSGTWRIMGNMEETGATGSSANTSLALRIS